MSSVIRTEPIKEFTLASVNRYAAIATLLANSAEVEPAKHALVAIDIRDDVGQRCAASAGVTKPEMDAVFASSDAGYMEIPYVVVLATRKEAALLASKVPNDRAAQIASDLMASTDWSVLTVSFVTHSLTLGGLPPEGANNG